MGDLFELFEHDSILNEEENASIENFFVDHPEFMYDSKLGLVTDRMDYIKLKLVELENNLLNWDDATAEKVHTTFPNAPKDGTASIPDPLLARRLGKPRTNCYKAKP
ncbi:hypothetical protein FXO38_32318 [Capsicum annuum]|nr:hypothetical protein FXO38_32318 [Capsicum annuum]KAF3643709.1 hypothetical protein FXO37_21853 [Capsicum annuum]